MAGKTHRYGYKGEIIAPCERAKGEHRGRWVVLSERLGMAEADETLSPHHTLKAAQEYISAPRESQDDTWANEDRQS